jgi:hypothetical protein
MEDLTMRMLVTVDLDTEKGNELLSSGRIAELIQGIMAKIQPEVAYFHERNGGRAITLVAEAADDASMVPMLQPFWMELGARVSAVPCMNADDLATGMGRL